MSSRGKPKILRQPTRKRQAPVGSSSSSYSSSSSRGGRGGGGDDEVSFDYHAMATNIEDELADFSSSTLATANVVAEFSAGTTALESSNPPIDPVIKKILKKSQLLSAMSGSLTTTVEGLRKKGDALHASLQLTINSYMEHTVTSIIGDTELRTKFAADLERPVPIIIQNITPRKLGKGAEVPYPALNPSSLRE